MHLFQGLTLLRHLKSNASFEQEQFSPHMNVQSTASLNKNNRFDA